MSSPTTYADAALATVAVNGGRIVGGPSITVATGKGALFGSPSTGAPMSISVYRSGAFVTVLKCTGVTGDVLTIDGAWDDHADAAINAGDEVNNGPTKKDLNDLWTWVKTPGPTGPTGAAGSVWREGSGAPGDATGVDGDYYLDGSTGNVYSRAAGVYAVVCNIKGATGATGSAGATGPTGAAGTPGSVWREGAGAPSDAVGVDGDFYLDGATGNVYKRAAGTYSIVADIKGPKGDAGATGPAGPAYSTLGAANQVLGINNAASDFEYKTITAGSGVTVTNGTGTITIAASGGGGLTSVGLTMPGGLTVTGSPLTANGTIAVSTSLSGVLKGTGTGLAAAVAGTDYVVPSGSITGTAANVTGTVAAANGGTGLTAIGTANQVAGVNAGATALEYKTLTAGSGVTITHSAGAVTIAATGGGSGTVTSVGLTMPGGLTVTGSPVTTSGTLAVSTALTGIVKAGGGNFSAAADGTDYYSSSTLPGALSGYAPLASPSFTGTVAVTGGTGGTGGTGHTTVVSSGASDTISTSNNELVMEGTGDTYGTVRLRLQNRDGSNGALFENAGVALVDFGFKAGGVQKNIRFETRYTSTFSGANEFQFIKYADGSVNTVLADLQAYFFGKTALVPSAQRTGCVGGGAPPLATLDVRGGMRFQAGTVSSAYTMTLDDYRVGVDTTSAAVAVTLPASAPSGQSFAVCDKTGSGATHNVTVNAPSGGSINGASTAVINTAYGALQLVSWGSNVFTIEGKV